MFKFTEEELKEWNNAENEEILANIVIRDAKSKGCIFVSKVNEPEPNQNAGLKSNN